MRRTAIAFVLIVVSWNHYAFGADITKVEVIIENHRFQPAEIHVPAGKPAVLTIVNKDGAVEEFDSDALKVEKVMAGGKSATVHLRPLAAGKYPFMGEYHADTARGVVIAE